jgi:hypothetical protein
MRRTLYKKYISFLMVMVMFTISVTGFCRSACATELPSDTKYEHGTGYLSAIEKGCPFCPIDQHSVPDHCDSSCHCPCHAPLTEQPGQLVCSQQISPLVFPEPFKALPEVYLSKFIPPHILV